MLQFIKNLAFFISISRNLCCYNKKSQAIMRIIFSFSPRICSFSTFSARHILGLTFFIKSSDIINLRLKSSFSACFHRFQGRYRRFIRFSSKCHFLCFRFSICQFCLEYGPIYVKYRRFSAFLGIFRPF